MIFIRTFFSQTILKDGVINKPNEIFRKSNFFSWYITYINKPQTKPSCVLSVLDFFPNRNVELSTFVF